MIHEARRRSGARGLVVTTAMALCGIVPMVGAAGPATADGPVVPQGGGGGGAASAKAKAKRARAARTAWRPVRSNFAVSTSAPSGPILPGRTYSWPYSVTNLGRSAQSVRFSATMPSNVAFVSGQQNCSLQAAKVVCELGTMQPGQTETGFVMGKILTQSAAGQAIAMTAVVTGTVVKMIKVGDAGRVKWGSLTVQKAFPQVVTASVSDLTVTTSAASQVQAGGVVLYKITVRNLGPSVAQNVVVTDVVQSKAEITVTKGAGICVPTGGVGGAGAGFVCDLGTVAAGGTETFTLGVRVAPTARAGWTLSAPVKVTTSTAEMNMGNNVAGARTRVVAPGAAYAERRAAPYLGMRELPRTGEQSGRLVTISLGLVAFGVLLIGIGGYRRRQD